MYVEVTRIAARTLVDVRFIAGPEYEAVSSIGYTSRVEAEAKERLPDTTTFNYSVSRIIIHAGIGHT